MDFTIYSCDVVRHTVKYTSFFLKSTPRSLGQGEEDEEAEAGPAGDMYDQAENEGQGVAVVPWVTNEKKKMSSGTLLEEYLKRMKAREAESDIERAD